MTDPAIRSMELLFQRVPYGVEVVWIQEGQEIYKLLHPLSKRRGDWLWKGEAKPQWGESSPPTFQWGNLRIWSLDKGKYMVGTRCPDVEKMRKWVSTL